MIGGLLHWMNRKKVRTANPLSFSVKIDPTTAGANDQVFNTILPPTPPMSIYGGGYRYFPLHITYGTHPVDQTVLVGSANGAGIPVPNMVPLQGLAQNVFVPVGANASESAVQHG